MCKSLAVASFARHCTGKIYLIGLLYEVPTLLCVTVHLSVGTRVLRLYVCDSCMLHVCIVYQTNNSFDFVFGQH